MDDCLDLRFKTVLNLRLTITLLLINKKKEEADNSPKGKAENSTSNISFNTK